ncbi:MAG TPA: sigma 54-interacting transcriptional regulator [Candidatus Angelobacter sp.]|jgi:two-component system response regulator AtoC|nr:sigma 54-interacting transcriptional regulator [Candidatus Angelobacter sp.]
MPPESIIFGQTAAMAAVRENIQKLAGANIPVLITGESGTGKELVARLIHLHCLAPHKPFVQVNCAAIPVNLIESELFGYEKGAFTGAVGAKPGRMEAANTGTLFMDEVGELSMAVQAKLLQVLQDGTFSRLGAEEDKKVDVRFVFATNRELEEEILLGSFREDLFYRINVINLQLPPLRERLEDVPALMEYFRGKYNEKYNRRTPPVSQPSIDCMQQYHWPGNIRQLENLMKRYVVFGTEESLLSELEGREPDLFRFTIPPDGQVSLKEISRQAVRQIERKVILKIVEANGWNRKRAAKSLNISYRALLYKLKAVPVPPQHKRSFKKAEPVPEPEIS